MTKDLDFTQGSISKKILLFSLPLMAGNIFQQLYNVVDTLIVGRFLGEAPLAAVGSAYTLMIFITSILIGLTMGSGVYFSICHGQKNTARMKQSIYISFLSIGALSLFLNAISYIFLEEIIRFMQIPADVASYFRDYLLWIFSGIIAVFLYNYFAALLRAVGNSLIPLVFLIVSALLNIALDLLFILVFQQGVAGAAEATVIAEYASGLGILGYCLFYRKDLLVEKKYRRWNPSIFRDISRLSLLTSLQQSIMNFGILLVQGLVNSFGTIVMAAFAAGVKIDTLAYSPSWTSGMPSRPPSRRTMAPEIKSASESASSPQRKWSSLSLSSRASSSMPSLLSSWPSSSPRQRQKPSRSAQATSASKEPATSASASSPCCMPTIAPSKSPV